MLRIKDLFKRIRGLSVFGFGVSWEDEGLSEAEKGGSASVGEDGVAIGGKGGGEGGSATVGGSGIAVAGPGGGGGIGGSGGTGGGGTVAGDGVVFGGEGGGAGQPDRRGRGGRGGLELSGIPNQQLPDGTWLWDYGRGGDGANQPADADDSEE